MTEARNNETKSNRHEDFIKKIMISKPELSAVDRTIKRECKVERMFDDLFSTVDG